LAEADQGNAASLRRSANSQWVKAKSIFTPRCLAHYRDKELYHANLDDFVRAGELAKFTRIPKLSYNPPLEDIINKTLEEWAKLEDRNLYLAIGHELAFGLRIGEVAQARWGWHTTRAGYPVIDSTAVKEGVTVKAGSGIIQVRALDPWYTTMRRQIELQDWRTDAKDLIITGADTYRTDALFRAVSEWMRARGWHTRKTNHALRAYAGGQVAMVYGIYDA
jgi:integrase